MTRARTTHTNDYLDCRGYYFQRLSANEAARLGNMSVAFVTLVFQALDRMYPKFAQSRKDPEKRLD